MIHGTKKVKKYKTEQEAEADNALATKISKHLKYFMDIRHQEKKDLAYLNQFTEVLMELCCDITTIYNFRRELIEQQLSVTPEPELQAKILEANLKLTTKLIKSNPKTYAIWSFRQWLVMKLFLLTKTSQVVEGDLELCKFMLMKDEKNFHVWNYRHWLNSLTVNIDRAIQFVHEKIKSNPFNFSPYHFLTKHIMEKYDRLIGVNHYIMQYGMDKKVFEEELEMVRTAVGMNPQEEAPWNFYKWMIRRTLPCRVLESKQTELGYSITTNFKVSSFGNSIKLTGKEGEKITGWALKSISGAEPSTSWILELPKETDREGLQLVITSNYDLEADHVRTEYGYLFLGTSSNPAIITESKRILEDQIGFVQEVSNEYQGKCRFASLTLLELFRLTINVSQSNSEWTVVQNRAKYILQALQTEQKGKLYIVKLTEAWKSLSAGAGPQLRPEYLLLLQQLTP